MANFKETYEAKKAEFQGWWYGFTYRTETKIRGFGNWVSQNKEVAIAAIPFAIVGLKTAGNAIHSLNRKSDLRKEQELKDLYIYDRSLGKYHKLRRPMRTSEMLELDRRKANGESMICILNDMRLLD